VPRARKPGGPRLGQPGKAYGNRTDLNVNRTAGGQGYGVRGAQDAALQAVPLRPNPAAQVGPGAQQQPPPGGGRRLPPLDRPTERPEEALTAGMGANPAEMWPRDWSEVEQVGEQLRALYRQFPSDDLRDLLEAMED